MFFFFIYLFLLLLHAWWLLLSLLSTILENWKLKAWYSFYKGEELIIRQRNQVPFMFLCSFRKCKVVIYFPFKLYYGSLSLSTFLWQLMKHISVIFNSKISIVFEIPGTIRQSNISWVYWYIHVKSGSRGAVASQMLKWKYQKS